MRILHIAPVRFNRPFGSSIYVSSLLNAASYIEGVQIGLLSDIPGSGLEDLEKRVFGLPSPTKDHWNPWKMDDSYLHLILKSFGRPDLVHFHGVYYPFHTAFAYQMRRLEIPYIVSVHGGFHPRAQRKKAWKKILGNLLFFNKFMDGAMAIHALNDVEAGFIQKRFPKKKFFIIPNGVPDSTASLIRPERFFEKVGVLTVGFIGRLDIHVKGIDLLLNAVREIQRRGLGHKFSFVFAGYFYTKKDERLFWDLVNTLPDPKAVKFKGVVRGEEKDKSFDSFDIFSHTSRNEGMPGSVLEAMARGIPCLVTPGTNMQEIILTCQGGWVCDPKAEAITDALLTIAGDPEGIIKKGAAAKRYALDYLMWSKIARQYIAQLKELLSKRGRVNGNP